MTLPSGIAGRPVAVMQPGGCWPKARRPIWPKIERSIRRRAVLASRGGGRQNGWRIDCRRMARRSPIHAGARRSAFCQDYLGNIPRQRHCACAGARPRQPAARAASHASPVLRRRTVGFASVSDCTGLAFLLCTILSAPAALAAFVADMASAVSFPRFRLPSRCCWRWRSLP